MSDGWWGIQLLSEALDGSELDIERVESVGTISQLPRTVIYATRIEGALIDQDALMLKPAELAFTIRDEEVHRIYGMVSALRDVAEPHMDRPRFEITLVPRAFSATMRENLDIFLDQSVPDIIEACLTRCGLSAGEHFDLGALVDEYPANEFVVQYKETDFAFISRLCEHQGIFFFIDYSQDRDVLTFGDDNSAFPTSGRTPELPFQPLDTGAGEVSEALNDRAAHVHIERSAMPRRYTVRDYNYRTPGVDLLASADVDPDGLGEIVEYGAHFKGPNEGQRFANIRAQELLSRQRVWNGEGVALALTAGEKTMLTQHPNGDVELLVTSVIQRWAPSDGEGGAPFGTRFTAIRAEVPYRPPRLTPKPKVNGVVTGMIDASAQDGYAEVDDQGRYRVRFMYDTAERGEGQASRLVRMAQPHAGEGYGMHFPLRPGVEVILSCVDGDPDRPIITGTVPNPSTASPVSSANRDRNLIRTGGGNEIDISDEDGMHRIKMSTPFAGTVFQLGAPNAAEEGAIISSGANVVTQTADTVAAFADGVSAIQEIKGSVTGTNVTSVAGIPNPIKGFEAVEKLFNSGLAASKGLAGLVDGVANFGKKIKDATDANAKVELKAAEDAILGKVKYPDDAEYVTTSSGQKIYETEAQMRKRLVAEKRDDATEAEREAYDDASASYKVVDPITGTEIDGSWGTGYGTSSVKAGWDAVNAGGDAASKSMAAAKKLFSTAHKKTQKLIDAGVYAGAIANTAKIATGAIAASQPRSFAIPRPPGENYHLSHATDSVINHGLQGAYSLTMGRSYTYGKSLAMVASDSALCLFGGSEAELAAKTVRITGTLKIDAMCRAEIKVSSGTDTTVDVGQKLTVTSDSDTKMESKADLFVIAKNVFDVDGGEDAKLKAKKWKFEATDQTFDVEVKGAMKATSKHSISLDVEDGEAVVEIYPGEVKLEKKGGSCLLLQSDQAYLEQDGGASLRLESSKAELDANTIQFKGNTFKANTKKVFLA